MEHASPRKIRRKRHRRKPKSHVLLWSALFLLSAAAILIVREFAIPNPAPRFPAVATAIDHPAKGLETTASQPDPSAIDAHLYSVIPGGVHSEKQLAKVLARDPVVARHYANFDLHKLRFIRLRRGRQAYVSYRLGNLIFWTNHKIPLYSGETLLTDGTHYARSRCGNRVSYVPKQPTSPLEPSDQALAAPILHLAPSSFTLPPLNEGVHLGPLPLDGGLPGGSSGGTPVLPVFLLPPGGGGGIGGSGGSGGTGGTPVGTPPGNLPVSVPEPSTIVLLSCGLIALCAMYLWSFWRD